MRSELIVSTLIGFMLFGCAHPPAPSMNAAPSKQTVQAAEAIEGRDVTSMPDWFMSAAEPDGLIVETATALASDLQLALDKAILDAKYRIAERLRSQISGEIEQFTQQNGQGSNVQFRQESRKVVSSLFSGPQVGTFHVARQKVTREGNSFRAFVMLELPRSIVQKQVIQAVEANPVLRAGLQADPHFKALSSPHPQGSLGTAGSPRQN